MTDYDYDANFGVVMNENDLDQISAKDPPSYDYSHFDLYSAVGTYNYLCSLQTVWLDDWMIFHYLVIYNNEHVPQSIKVLPKMQNFTNSSNIVLCMLS